MPTVPPVRLLLATCCLAAATSAQRPYESIGFHPGYRQHFGLEFDATSNEVLAFGSHRLATMWGWNGASWRQFESAVTGPLNRQYIETTSDPVSGRIFAYGGAIDTTITRELWQWNGTTWSLLSSGGPSPRLHTALAFDPAGQVLYLYGGVDPFNYPLGDLWRFDGTTWTQLPVGPTPPSARHNHAMVWDPTLGSAGGLFVVGGYSYFTGTLNDTWRWTAAGGWVGYTGPGP